MRNRLLTYFLNLFLSCSKICFVNFLKFLNLTIYDLFLNFINFSGCLLSDSPWPLKQYIFESLRQFGQLLFHRRIPMILNGVISPTLKYLRNVSPFIANTPVIQKQKPLKLSG